MTDKSGTAPEVLRLPKGGGSIAPISESFAADLKSGAGNYRIPIAVPDGRVPLPAPLELRYSSGHGNGPFGLGWTLGGVPTIQRRLDLGIPAYIDADCLEHSDMGELARVGPGRYRARVEQQFARIERKGDVFEVLDREGRKFLFGETRESRIFDPNDEQRIAQWFLSSVEDLNGNRTEYEYRRDVSDPHHFGGPAGQLYLCRINYNILPSGGFLYRIDLNYEFDGLEQNRPDPILSHRSGFALETNWRARSIEIKVGEDQETSHRFDVLPDGSAVDDYRRVVPDAFQDWGFRVDAKPPLGSNNLALFPAGDVLGSDSPVLTPTVGRSLVPGEVSISFLNEEPSKRVEVSFFGSNAIYILRAYDEVNRLIGEASVSGAFPSIEKKISVEAATATIHRIEFGGDVAFGISGISWSNRVSPLCRRYELAYDDTGPGRVSLLRSVQLFGEDLESGLLSRPPIVFGYSKADLSGREVVPIVGAPAVSLSDDKHEVVDLTGTATPDVLWTRAANDHKFYANAGNSSLGPVADISNAPATDLVDQWTGLGDVMGLVAADLFDRRKVYPNPSIAPGTALNGPLRWGDGESVSGFQSFPPSQRAEVRYLDLSGDGRIDILRTGENFQVWLQKPDHSFEKLPDIDRISSYLQEEWPDVSFADKRIKLADMTGDGLVDIVRVDPLATRIDFWPNTGFGKWGRKRMLFFDGAGLSFPLKSERMFFADIDNSGLVDLIYVDSAATGMVYIWPNQGGNAFGERELITGTPTVGSGDHDSVRLLDMTGAGTLGILWTRDGAAGEQTWYFMNLTGGVKPNLLTKIDNGTGGITEVNYASSGALYHSEHRAGRAWTSTAPFSVHVVDKIKRTDAITGLVEKTNYEYRDAYFDRERRKYEGFGKVTITHQGDMSQEHTVRGCNEVHHFRQQRLDGLNFIEKAEARALAGREMLIEHFDQDGTTLLKWERIDWKVVPVSRWQNGTPVQQELDQDDQTPVLFAYSEGRLIGTVEGTSDIRLTFEKKVRDLANPGAGGVIDIAASHGQLLANHQYGEVAIRTPDDTTSPALTTLRHNGANVDVVDVRDDTRVVTRAYAINEAANLIRMSSEITKDALGTAVAERYFFYDGPDYRGLPSGQISLGNLTRQSELVLRSDQRDAIYANSNHNADWSSLGYHIQTLVDGSTEGLFAHVQRYRYGAFGLPLGSLSPLGDESTFQYDGYHSRLHIATNPRSQSVSSIYDYRFGLPTAYTDENNQTWQRIYDGLGRVAKEIEPGDSEALPTRSYHYQDYAADSAGSPVSIILEELESEGNLSVVSTFQYFDGFLRDLQVRKPWQVRRRFGLPLGTLRRRAPLGADATGGESKETGTVTLFQVVDREYNARGKVARETLPYLDPEQNYSAPSELRPARLFSYDALLRNCRSTNPDDTFRSTDRAPWKEEVRDEADNTPESPHYGTPSAYYFNSRGKARRVERRLGTQILGYDFGYDLFGNLTQATDPASNEVHWYNDTRGLVLKSVHPDAGTTWHFYDANSQEVARVYANGDRIISKYDELQRLEQRKLGNPPRIETYSYDAGSGTNLVGRLSKVRDAAGTLNFAYDARGREIWQKRTYTDQTDQSYETHFIFDSMGRLKKITYPDETKTEYKFGVNGKVNSIDGIVSKVNYHVSGKPSAIYYSSGVRHSISYEPQTHRIGRRLVTIDGVAHHDVSYAYDEVGNVISLVDALSTPGHLQLSRNYSYDDLYRLKTFTSSQGHSESYDYDSVGNMVAHTGYSPNPLVYPTTGQTSALLGAQGETAWQYDINGRLEKGAGYERFEWDAAQNISKISTSDGEHQKFVHSFDGRIIKRTHVLSDGSSLEVRSPNKFYSSQPGVITKRVYLGDMLSAIIRKEDGNEICVTSITNELDHIINFIDDSGESNQTEYAPYGKLIFQERPGGEFGFAGKEEIAENLIAFDYRLLFTALGRWINPDPMLQEGTSIVPLKPEKLGVFIFANNNPTNVRDSLGLDPDVVQLDFEPAVIAGNPMHPLRRMDVDYARKMGTWVGGPEYGEAEAQRALAERTEYIKQGIFEKGMVVVALGGVTIGAGVVSGAAGLAAGPLVTQLAAAAGFELSPATFLVSEWVVSQALETGVNYRLAQISELAFGEDLTFSSVQTEAIGSAGSQKFDVAKEVTGLSADALSIGTTSSAGYRWGGLVLETTLKAGKP